MSDNKALKQFPRFDTDDDAERFVAEADLSDYDFSSFRLADFQFEPESVPVDMRLPKALFEAVKDRAQRRGIPYTRLIREMIEKDLAEGR